MNADLRTIRTEAEKAIADAWDAVAPSLPGGARVRARRVAAMDLYRRIGLPHRRIEEWKYTDLRALMRKAAPAAPRPSEPDARKAVASGDPLPGLDRYRLVVVDGVFFPALSDVAALAKSGVKVEAVAEALARDDADVLDAGRLPGDDIAVALNTAFAADGVSLNVPEGTVLDRPIEIAHIVTGTVMVAARHAIRIGARANVKIVATHRGTADGYQTNLVTLADIGRNAVVSFASLQADNSGVVHLNSTVLNAGDGAELKQLGIAAGGAVSRAQTFLTTGGAQTRVGLYGATMLGAKQHADATLLIDHALPGANTRVLYKSVVDGASEGVFQGKIIVEPDAQKTDAKMMSQALLLSDEATFAAKPELEIFADDVQCGHGATSGQIDETQLFYLMARGVPRPVAERLLIEAFLDDAIDALGDEAIGDALKASVTAWLNARGGAG